MVTHVDEISTPPTPADPPAVFEERAAQVWSDLARAVPQLNSQADENYAAAVSASQSESRAIEEADAALGYRNEANAAKRVAEESASIASSAKTAAEQARDESADYAALINPALTDASLRGIRNKIINGSFQINQRGYVSGATTAAGQYTLDRWKVTGSGGIAFSRTENKVTVTIPTGQTLQQVIEGLNLQSGNYVLSWEGSAQGRVGSGAYGASGSVTASVLGGTNTVIEFGAGTVSNVQFEIGLVPSPFEQKTVAIETIECQRYSEPTRIHIVGPAPSAGSYIGHRVFFKVTKRAIPTLSSAANPANFNTGGATANDVRVDGFNVYATALAAGALAEYSGDIFASAEL